MRTMFTMFVFSSSYALYLSLLLSGSKAGRTDAAVLTAINITDELFKAQAASEALRGQIKQYLDEAGKAQAEASELRREVFRLQQKLEGRGNGGSTRR